MEKRIKRKIFREEEFTYGVAVCPFCGYECDAILWAGGTIPSPHDDDVCEHFDRLEGEEVVFRELE